MMTLLTNLPCQYYCMHDHVSYGPTFGGSTSSSDIYTSSSMNSGFIYPSQNNGYNVYGTLAAGSAGPYDFSWMSAFSFTNDDCYCY
jgi:hypothetical protein